MNRETYDYEIRIRGAFDRSWADWFGGLEARRDGADTLVFLRNADHSAFYGTLRMLGDLNCRLISVQESGSKRADARTGSAGGNR